MSNEGRFRATEDVHKIGTGKHLVIYDNVTKIVYLKGSGASASSVTPLYNSDGEPMTLSEYNDTK